MGERDTREDVSKVFRLFDDDRTGAVEDTGHLDHMLVVIMWKRP